MKQFNKFYFEKYEFDKKTLKASFYYSFDKEVFFEEIIDFSSTKKPEENWIDLKILNNYLFNCHIALWISYYKAFPTSEIIIKSWFLDKKQIIFWKKFYLNWLWEFLYTNKIDPNIIINCKWEVHSKNKNFITSRNKNFVKKDIFLIPLWWWKDSLVSLELIKKLNYQYETIVFWKIDHIKEKVSKVVWRNPILIKRDISKELFKLNKEWYYNWHVPITWIIAFILITYAHLNNYKYIVLSNELSANTWNLNWKWVKINHQYSKSLEFEKDFKKYTEEYITKDIKYFSLLRWLYEIKIAELFSKLWKKYFSTFSSCNFNFKIFSDKKLKQIDWKYWCNKCPKCAFVFSILYPYLTNAEILEIFWEDLYDREDLKTLFKELLWITWNKPFECVWEAEEVILAMSKSITNYELLATKWKLELPYILKIFNDEVFCKLSKDDIKKLEEKLFKIYDEDIIPEEIKEKIKFTSD